MKTLLALLTVATLGIAPAVAEDKFALPDLTVEQPKPPTRAKGAAEPALTPAKSQWEDEEGKPGKSFGDIQNGPCNGCKLSVTVRQAPLYPDLGPAPGWTTPDTDQ